MTISIRLSNEDAEVFKAYASMNGISISELVRRAVLDRIEDEHDLKAFDDALAEYRANPVTYSHEDVLRMLELD